MAKKKRLEDEVLDNTTVENISIEDITAVTEQVIGNVEPEVEVNTEPINEVKKEELVKVTTPKATKTEVTPNLYDFLMM